MLDIFGRADRTTKQTRDGIYRASKGGKGGHASPPAPTAWTYIGLALGNETKEGAAQRWVKNRDNDDWKSAVSALLSAATLVGKEKKPEMQAHLYARINLWLANLINMASPAELQAYINTDAFTKIIKFVAGPKANDPEFLKNLRNAPTLLAKSLYEKSIGFFGKVDLGALYKDNSVWAVAEKATAYKGLAEACIKKAQDCIKYSQPEKAPGYLKSAEAYLLNACDMYQGILNVIPKLNNKSFTEKESYIPADYASTLAAYGTICLIRIQLDPSAVTPEVVKEADERLEKAYSLVYGGISRSKIPGSEWDAVKGLFVDDQGLDTLAFIPGVTKDKIGKLIISQATKDILLQAPHFKLPNADLSVKVATAGVLCTRARLALEMSYKTDDTKKASEFIDQAEKLYARALDIYGPMTDLHQEYMREAKAGALKDHAQLVYVKYVNDYYGRDQEKRRTALTMLTTAKDELSKACDALSAIFSKPNTPRSEQERIQYAQTLNLRAEITLALAADNFGELTNAYNMVTQRYSIRGIDATALPLDVRINRLSAEIRVAAAIASLDIDAAAALTDGTASSTEDTPAKAVIAATVTPEVTEAQQAAKPAISTPAKPAPKSVVVKPVVTAPTPKPSAPMVFSSNGKDVLANGTVIAIAKDPETAKTIADRFIQLKPRSVEAKMIDGDMWIVDSDYYEILSMAGGDVAQAKLFKYNEKAVPGNFTGITFVDKDQIRVVIAAPRFATEVNSVLWGNNSGAMTPEAEALMVARRKVGYYIGVDGNTEKLNTEKAIEALEYLVKHLSSSNDVSAKAAAEKICASFLAKAKEAKSVASQNERDKIQSILDSLSSTAPAQTAAPVVAAPVVTPTPPIVTAPQTVPVDKWVLNITINGTRVETAKFDTEADATRAAAAFNAPGFVGVHAVNVKVFDIATHALIFTCATEAQAKDIAGKINSALPKPIKPAPVNMAALQQPSAKAGVSIKGFEAEIKDSNKLIGLLKDITPKTQNEKEAIGRSISTAQAAIIEASISIAQITAKQAGTDTAKINDAIKMFEELPTKYANLFYLDETSAILQETNVQLKQLFDNTNPEGLPEDLVPKPNYKIIINGLAISEEKKTQLLSILDRAEGYKYLRVKTCLALANMYAQAKDYAKAIDACGKAFAAVPDNSSSFYDCAIALGNVLALSKDTKTAENIFNALLGKASLPGDFDYNKYPYFKYVTNSQISSLDISRTLQAKVGRVKAMFASSNRNVHQEARKEAVNIINDENTPLAIKMLVLENILESLDYRWEDEALVSIDSKVGLEISGNWGRIEKTQDIPLSAEAQTALNTTEPTLKHIPVMPKTEK